MHLAFFLPSRHSFSIVPLLQYRASTILSSQSPAPGSGHAQLFRLRLNMRARGSSVRGADGRRAAE